MRPGMPPDSSREAVFTVSIVNEGDMNAEGVHVRIALPGGVQIVMHTQYQDNQQGGQVSQRIIEAIGIARGGKNGRDPR